MKFDLYILNEYINNGLIQCQSHPNLPLKIYNYTRECQYLKKWDDITLNMRGTILDNDGNLIARSFPKFFNYEELSPSKIPWSDNYVYVQDKEDGSLGIIFWYEGEWIVATRGSFVSDQAIAAKKMLNKLFNTSAFLKEVVYIVEIIYPENRIVIDYGEDKLIFLAAHYKDIESGYSELNWMTAKGVLHASGIEEKYIVTTDYINVYDLDVSKLKALNLENREGYVLRFYPSNFRMKIKFEEYIRMHSLLTNFSNKDIWKSLMFGNQIDLENVPDEFDLWVKDIMYNLTNSFDKEKVYFNKIFSEFMESNSNTFTKKEYAKWVMTRPSEERSILFNLYDKKSIDELIWMKLKPKYQKPFFQSSGII